MTADEFLSLADNPDLIEGIYNYCDRWCERCPMTHRCLLYASTPANENLPAGSSKERKHAMIRQIEASFSLTIDLLNKMASEGGINIPDPEEADRPIQEHERQQVETQKSPLTHLAKRYLDDTKYWFDHCDASLLAKDKELEQITRMQLPDRDPASETEEIKNAMDVIHWYQAQIMVKLVRAQTPGMRQMDWDQNDGDHLRNDADGSAKVALIGIDRSIGAWGILLQSLPDQEENILNLLTTLERLRRLTEETFPNARNFKRPGLND